MRLVGRQRFEADRQIAFRQRQQRRLVADQRQHRLAAKARRAGGQHRLVAQVGEDGKGVVRHVGRGEHVDDARPAPAQRGDVADLERGVRMRRADDAQREHRCRRGQRSLRDRSQPAIHRHRSALRRAPSPARRAVPRDGRRPRRPQAHRQGRRLPRPPRAPPRRSWCSRCIGTARRPARRAPRPRSACVAPQQRLGAHQHAGRADAALRRAHRHESALQERELAAGAGKAFDGAHDAAFALADGDDARAQRLAVEQHGAGAAVAGMAADLGADEAELVAQGVGEAARRCAEQLGRGAAH